MRSILVFADRAAAMTSRLETALSLARADRGHITVIVDTPVSRYISMDPMGGSYVASDALSEALENDDAYAAEIEAHLDREDVPFDVLRCEDEPVDALSAAARLSDVVLVSHGCPFAGQLALNARAPVLVLPQDRRLSVPVPVTCVGWDGGMEAALALRSAISLVAAGGQVHVLTIDEKPGGFPSGDAMRYLSRHGVSAELHALTRGVSTEETLAGAVKDLGADLLVMGAYGHSRMREYLFGGVTRYFLEAADGPALLLAH
ncbi:MAG: universal stress protein [Sphingomonadales bacterium]|nr:universal stress protein [Sphingomonadales bacterium]